MCGNGGPLFASGQTLDDSGKRQVLHTMVKFISNAEIQVLCCHMLGTLATTGKGWGGGRKGGREGGRDKQAESNGVEKY